MASKQYVFLGICLFFLVWVGLHLPPIRYGTIDVPLHMAYIGDEQSPLNGSLHMAAEKSLLALRDRKTVYYGPLFSVVGLPAVAVDFLVKKVSGEVLTSEDYKASILYDWGGIARNARVIAVFVGFLGLLGCFLLFREPLLNPSGSRVIPWIAVFLLGFNFYYFEYASFFKHWIFISVILVWQLYILARIIAHKAGHLDWVITALLTAFGFGISYLAIFFQIVWLPVLVDWVRKRDRASLVRFGMYALVVSVLAGLIVWWHPHAFTRIIGLVTSDIGNVDSSQFSSEEQATGLSFEYYARIIFINHPALIAFLLGSLMFSSLRKRIIDSTWFWSVFALGFGYFVLFGSISHHESRYIIPSILALILLSVFVASQLMFETDMKMRMWKRIGFILIGLMLLFHILAIGAWERTMLKGPPERAMIAELVALQEKDPTAKFLLIQYYLLGYPHTEEAYRDYVENSGKEDVSLYKEILKTTPPDRLTPLNVYYERPDATTSVDRVEYVLVAEKYTNQPEPDYLEVNLFRLWFASQFTERYFFYKVPE